jgi:hypothetical protein
MSGQTTTVAVDGPASAGISTVTITSLRGGNGSKRRNFNTPSS